MRVVDEGAVFTGTAGTRTASCCFPSLTRVGARWVATWRAGSTKDSADGAILASHSDDGGASWSSPIQPWSSAGEELRFAPIATIDGELWAAIMRVDRSGKTRPLFNPATEGLLPVRTWLSRSLDGGESWSPPLDLGEGPRKCPSPLTGPVMQLAGGILAMPFETNKPFDDPSPWLHAAAFRLSRDGGQTWDESCTVMTDLAGQRMYWDQHHARNASGQHIAAFWVYDRQANQDATIHLASADVSGLEWSRPWDTCIRGQIAHPILFDDGRLLMVYVDRYGERGIFARVSRDAGKTFDSEVLCVYRHPNPTKGLADSTGEYLDDMNLWTFGRVEGFADGDGRALLLFYAGSSSSARIAWVCVEL